MMYDENSPSQVEKDRVYNSKSPRAFSFFVYFSKMWGNLESSMTHQDMRF